MLPRRSNTIEIISVVSVLLLVVVFFTYHIFFNNYIFGKNFMSEDARSQTFVNRSIAKFQGMFNRVLHLPHSGTFKGEKLIHLDLKGAPPTVSYYRQFFPFLRKLGVTGLVIEYEDMFYYKDQLEGIRALNAYPPDALETILELAKENDLTVIPLIQTFGHFEFVLKLQEYKDLREVNAFPQALCPSHERVWGVIKNMIDQVLEAHPQSKYIHIGCDEVMHLGQCNRCKSVLYEKGWSTAHLYLDHVKKIALYINNTYPGVRPIVWGDMIGRFSESLLHKSKIADYVDVMVWKYAPSVSKYITYDMFQKYANVFKTIWIGSAFKGATGVSQKTTDIWYHLENHVAWMQIVSSWKHSIHFKGILLTGWQRYDHFAELCELLPVGIPSLAVCMNYLTGSEAGENERGSLKCESTGSFFPFSYLPQLEGRERCDFPGFRVYDLITKFHRFAEDIKGQFSVVQGGWFSVYAALHKFSSPVYVKKIFNDWPLDSQLQELKALEEDLKKALLEVYDVYTVEEWITSYLAPLRIRLEAFWIAKEEILEQDAWPRRPLLTNSDGLERAAKEICTSDRKFGCALLLT